MLPFLHARHQQLVQLLEQATALFQRFQQRDLGLEAELDAWLARSAGVLKSLSLPAAENECASLRGQWAAAREGIDPFRREAVETQRRALRRLVALHVLDSLAQRLRELLAHCEATLAQGRAQLQPIVLAALNAGIVDEDTLRGQDAQRVEALWRRLLADAGAAPAARQVALSQALPDIVLLIEDLLAAARS